MLERNLRLTALDNETKKAASNVFRVLRGPRGCELVRRDLFIYCTWPRRNIARPRLLAGIENMFAKQSLGLNPPAPLGSALSLSSTRRVGTVVPVLKA